MEERVVSCDEVRANDISFGDTPFIIREGLKSFHRIPIGTDSIKKFLYNTFGECKVPLTKNDETLLVKLADWETNTEWYLKDWHVNSACASLGIEDLFTTPIEFTDWFNEFYRTSKEYPDLDFQFLYWGKCGTATPYHQDVLGTFSWSHNLCGKKLWKFYMHDNKGSYIISVSQGPGETVFVPSGCFHTVENLVDDTISINQNWFNEFNIMHVAKRLCMDSENVVKELNAFGTIFDSQEELAVQVSIIVKANNSLNVDIFAIILAWRLEHCQPSMCVVKRIRSVVDFLQSYSHILTLHATNKLFILVKP